MAARFCHRSTFDIPFSGDSIRLLLSALQPTAVFICGSQPVEQPIDATRAYRFLQTIVTTEDEELDCEEVMAVIARYVDLETDGGCSNESEAGVPLHLSHCAHCAEMYQTLRALASLEAKGCLPPMDELWSDLHSAVDGEQERLTS